MRLNKLWLFFYAFLLLAGCKKTINTGSDGKYYMRFKMDGQQKEFSLAVAAQFPDTAVAGWYGGDVTGVASDGSMEQMTLSLLSNEAVQINETYEINYQGSTPLYNDLPIISYTTFTASFSSAVHTLDSGYKSGKITITELTDEGVKGTFSGLLLSDQDDPGSVKYSITDGEFYAMRTKAPPNTNAGNGDGYIEFTLEGKTHRIDENSSSSNSALADLSDGTSGNYNCFLLWSDPMASPSRVFSFFFFDNSPFVTQEYQYVVTPPSVILTAQCNLQFTYSVLSKSYFYIVDPATSAIVFNITKLENRKGGKMEGTFSVTNLVKYSGDGNTQLAKNLHLTNGKFRTTVK